MRSSESSKRCFRAMRPIARANVRLAVPGWKDSGTKKLQHIMSTRWRAPPGLEQFLESVPEHRLI